MRTSAFIVEKIEKPVMTVEYLWNRQRASEAPSELVVAQHWLGSATNRIPRRKLRRGVESIVLEEFIESPVILVGARFRCDIDLRGGPAEFRRVVFVHQADSFYGINRRCDCWRLKARVVVINTINEVLVGVLLASANKCLTSRELRAVSALVASISTGKGLRSYSESRRTQRQELHEVPGRKGHVGDFLRADERRDCGCVRVEPCVCRGYFNRLGDVSGAQFYVHAQ